MAPKKNKKKSNGKARADEISADFGYDESEPDVEIKDEETAADLKVRGNECVKSGDHAVAIKLFTVAIERNPPKEELHLYHSNRSVCALSLKRFPMAIADAEQCVALKPDWSKGYSRLGAACMVLGQVRDGGCALLLSLARTRNPRLAPGHGQAHNGGQQTDVGSTHEQGGRCNR